ncbi:MAG: Holliday junction resolvase RuvX [Alphaproteobacteria bacterium]|nr:Holliday junction resolvase RuvX [Alphaproteobacteria bacterium]
MILPDFKAFPRVGRIVGIDWGMRRIGVAVSDPERNFVFARDVLNFARGDTTHAARVARLAVEEGGVAIVVGLPIRNDGTESETTKMVRDFVADLERETDVPICMIEENLTSMVAQESMGRVRVRDIKEKLDSESARVILENAIALINRAS